MPPDGVAAAAATVIEPRLNDMASVDAGTWRLRSFR